MLTTVVIGLVCFAVAFISGGALSKAYFATRGAPNTIGRKKLHALLQAQRIRYRKRMIALNNVILRHENTRDQIRDKLTNFKRSHAERGKLLSDAKEKIEKERKHNQDLQRKLTERDRLITELNVEESNVSTLEKEHGMLRIERDELAARIARVEAEQAQLDATTRDAIEIEDEIAHMRADMGELRETLATRDRRVHDLELQFRDSAELATKLQAKLDNWKQRVTPLTRKLKKQKEVIRKLCQPNDTEAPAEAPAEAQAEAPGDDLKAIRGIGPALERRLQQHGIRHYRQLAELTTEKLSEIAPNLAGRDAWIEQAREFVKQTELCETA